jgi:hypothetical protein
LEDGVELAHIAQGISLLRLSEERPDAGDLISDPELWRAVYFEHRGDVLRVYGPHCEAARRFEPDRFTDDNDDDSEDD